MADQQKYYDAVIVGSGFAGATLAKKLGEANKKVLILEAGPAMPSSREDYMENFFLSTFKSPEAPYPPNHLARDPGRTNAPRPSIPDLVFGWKKEVHEGKSKFVESTDHGQESYLIGKEDYLGDITPFASTYERIAGGTGNHWMGTCLRMSERDFKLNKTYGVGKDWPIEYKDLEQHYLAVEKLIGVSGDPTDQEIVQSTINKHRTEEHRDQPMHFEFPMPGIPKSYGDRLIGESLAGKDRETGQDKMLAGLPAVVTSTPAARNSAPYQNRRVCHGNTACTPICPIQAKYDPTIALNQALETGNVNILYKHVVEYLTFDNEKRNVTDIHVIRYEDISVPANEKEALDKRKGLLGDLLREGELKLGPNTIFVLAANALENAKIMLLSFRNISKAYEPTRSDALIGKHLMDHPVYLAWALTPEDSRVYGYRGPLSTSGIETGRDGEFRRERAAWRIEIGNEGWSWPTGDPYTTAQDFIYGNPGKVHQDNEILFGSDYVMKVNDILTRQIRISFLVEQEANEHSFIRISDTKTDNLNIPRIEVHYHISDYVRKGFRSAEKAAEDLFNHMNATPYTSGSDDDVLQFTYDKIVYYYQGAGHVCGTHIMGESADTAVVDKYQKCFSHPNLYMIGCGSMPSIGTQNPTLTMLAMTDMTGEHILKEFTPALNGGQ